MKKLRHKLLSIILSIALVTTFIPSEGFLTVYAADVPITELWVGATQVVQSGGTVTANTSGAGWSFDSTTATLTLNGANITTMAHDGVTGPSGSMDNYFYYGIYCYGDLNIVVAGDSTIDAGSAAFKSNGIYVSGNLAVSGSAKLTAKGNWRGVNVVADLNVSEAVTLIGIAGGSTYDILTGVYVTESITVSDTASLTGHALVQLKNYGMQCYKGNITVGSNATLTAIADDGYSGDGSESYGLYIGYTNTRGQVSVEGTLVAHAGDSSGHGYANGLFLYNTDLVVSGSGSVRAESGEESYGGATSYGVKTSGSAEITVNGGGFLASGGTCAVNPATASISISGSPVFYEVSANRDGSNSTECTDTDTWNSTYNGQFSAYKYINATTFYEVYVNGTQVTRVNRNDILGDGTVSYTPASDTSPARLELNGADLTTVQLGTDTELVLTGENTIETVTNTGEVTVSGSGELTLTDSLDCGSKRLTVSTGAELTMQGTITAGTVVNNGTLKNEGIMILPEATTLEQIQAMNLTVSGVIKVGNLIYYNNKSYTESGNVGTTTLDLSTGTPTTNVCYQAGNGYILWDPETSTLTLNNATINTGSADAIVLPQNPVTVDVIGTNSIVSTYSAFPCGIKSESEITITGAGTLNTNSIYTDDVITINADGTINTPSITAKANFVYTKGNLNAFVWDYKGDNHNNMVLSVYGNYTLTDHIIVWNRTGQDGLTVMQGATLTIPDGKTLQLDAGSTITNNGTIINNGTIFLPTGTTVAQLKAMKITGIGRFEMDGKAIRVAGDEIYSDGGDVTATWLILTTAPTEKTAYKAGNGYAMWEPTVENDTITSGTLTLNNAEIKTDGLDVIILPNVPVTINVIGTNSIITAYSAHGINSLANITIQGTGVLNVEAKGAGIICNTSLTIAGGVTVNTMADSLYGIVVNNGKLTVDNKSKLITNAKIAPFAITDTSATPKAQKDVISLPGLPRGTQIKSATSNGTTGWSLVQKGGTLAFDLAQDGFPNIKSAATGLLTFAYTPPAPSPEPTQTPEPTIPQQIKEKLDNTSAKPIEIAKTSNSEFKEIKAEAVLSKATDAQKEALKNMTEEQINAEIKKAADAIATVNTTKISEKAKKKIEEVKKSLSADAKIMPINFTVHAEFAFPVEVSISVDKSAYPAGTYYLYYYNEETGKVEDCGEVTVDANGVATFTISHCSDYFISSKKIDVAASNVVKTVADTTATPAKNPKTGERNTLGFISIIAILSVTTLTVVTRKRKFKLVKKG